MRSVTSPALLLTLTLAALAPGLRAQDAAGSGEVSHLGTWTHTIEGLEGPVALDFGPEGELWVAEADADRVRRFDLSGEQARILEDASVWGGPSGLAVGTRLYVSDPARRRVVAVGREVWQEVDVVLSGPEELCDPQGIAAVGGRLAVADGLGGVVRWLWRDRRERLGEGLLACPTGVALTSDGWLFVVDRDRARVERFTPEGEHAGGFGDFGAFPGLFAAPQGIATWGGRVFVADTENHRVSVHDTEGRLLYTLGTHAIRPREGEGRLHYPAAVAVSANGQRLAVAEPLDGRVQVFTRAPGAEPPKDPLRALAPQASPHYGPPIALDGPWMLLVEPETHAALVHDLRTLPAPSEITAFGRRGTSMGRYLRPTGVALDAAGRRAWVVDPTNATLDEVRIRIDPEAPLNQHLGAAAWVRRIHLRAWERDLAGVQAFFDPAPSQVAWDARSGSLWVLDQRNRAVLEVSPDGACLRTLGAGLLLRPTDLALGSDGVLWVADELAGRVVGLRTEDGRVHRTLGEGALQRPAGVCVDADGRVFVTDAARHRILRFDPVEGLDLAIGQEGLGPAEFRGPRGLTLDGDGNLMVVDHGNHRCVVVTPDGAFVRAFGSKLYVRPAMRPAADASESAATPEEGR